MMYPDIQSLQIAAQSLEVLEVACQVVEGANHDEVQLDHQDEQAKIEQAAAIQVRVDPFVNLFCY